MIDQTENTWLKAGRLSFSMKRKVITVNIVDCFIAVIAQENNCKIMTFDEHFKGIKNISRLHSRSNLTVDLQYLFLFEAFLLGGLLIPYCSLFVSFASSRPFDNCQVIKS